MFPRFNRSSYLGVVGSALVILAGCSGSPTSPSPSPSPIGPPAPVPVADEIQRVTVTLRSLVVTGSCDRDSIFESAANGEFQFAVWVAGGASGNLWETPSTTTYNEATHIINRAVTFNRNVTKNESFQVRFSGTEYDGALGADSDFKNEVNFKEHTYAGDRIWRPSNNNQSIGLSAKRDANLCGAHIVYDISSTPVG